MIKTILICLFGFLIGAISVFFILKSNSTSVQPISQILPKIIVQKPEIIGFLPYWLISQDQKNYAAYVNNINYFGLTVDTDGTILKRTKPTETEPGWLALKSGKVEPILMASKKNNQKRSLVIFSGNQETIDRLMDDPVNHAQNLVTEVSPILSQYDFTDLNIDIENVSEASESARQRFTLFTKIVHDELKKQNNAVTISIDVSPIALIKPYLIDVSAISSYVDKVIFMTYDFHYQGSSVTGAVSPINGAGTSAEFDVKTAIKEALKILPPEKIILGAPLYGYEWETLSDHPHAAVIPGTGIVASNKRIEDLLSTCASCSAQFDPVGKESYLIYKDQDTNTFHQFFYPNKQAMQEKVDLVHTYQLGGIALWALGYEGNTILEPLKSL